MRGQLRRGRPLPAAASDYYHLDSYAAELAFQLVKLINARCLTSSNFLRKHMAGPGAPACIAGDPGDHRAFVDAKRSMSKCIGWTAREIPDWDLVFFILAMCGSGADYHIPRLAGLWRASQRYGPPDYDGEVLLPDGAPAPYSDINEAPSDKVRVQVLLTRLCAEREHRDFTRPA
ncbi:hypothetical protein [Lentzea flava]|uniref:Uncharacterized protein n=1 Tax=Lentzea flava TaxID=103732 RepID=A0ABQ2UCE4_9PSEU|nr:hypothetical protein [Lentzea flava]MCP2196970.1 hypothetical protein [Lentzea flava]GGU14185.1 hypothetical protein GCM10010178_01950 [Lentzea flava]